MKIELYPHQELAVAKMHNGCILCGGVGSGKSRTALAYFFTKICDGEINEYVPPKKVKDLYIITTAMKRDTKDWESECSLFLLSTDKEDSVSGIRVFVDSWNNIKKYKDVQNAFFIFDEQRVVGYGTWSRTFIHISRNNEWVLLSATPGDTWMDYIPVFIANGFYKNKTEFIRKHVVFSRYTKYPKVEKYLRCSELVKHRKDILINMKFVRTTTPHKETVMVNYDSVDYDIVVNKMWNLYKNKPIKSRSERAFLARKILNNDTSRLEVVKELLQKHPRCIIFYNFDYELDILRTLSRETEVKERNGKKHDPLPTSDKWVYLVQYASGAESWNCITTDTIIFYSLNYSYRQMLQAAGRIDRANTPYKDLYYYYLRSRAPLDMAISKALANKKDFNESAFFHE